MKNNWDYYSTKEFEREYFYDGDDLGVRYSKSDTSFRIWAPTADYVNLKLYTKGEGNNLIEAFPMNRDVKGTWYININKYGSMDGFYYVYEIRVNNQVNEVVDPYARAVGVNGKRAMIIDLEKTNPQGWDRAVRPKFCNTTDAIIYELHVRDLSISESSGIKNKGKFLGLAEVGTKNSKGYKTGLDHIKELGITHLQLLPIFDYKTVDESRLNEAQYNWGYDPQNYNVPDGSYSTDPYNGECRVKEFKEMVKALHDNGIRLIMDVVYNHTADTIDSEFNKILPGYFYRSVNGQFTNGSGCGNETASERAMVRKFIVDSVIYWAREYKISGFRFDLMGLHDIETMNLIRTELDKIDPSIILYGEGWDAGGCPYPEEKRGLKRNVKKLLRIGAFSDDLRDAIRGHVFNNLEKGFVSGAPYLEESLKFGIVGGVFHSQIDMSKVRYSREPWASTPAQSISYVSAHDNLTLWDKLQISNPDSTRQELIQMNKMAIAIMLTSQGIPFIHGGEDILRTKDGDENSYKSPDSVNMIDWEEKTRNIDYFNYVKGLIEFRKSHPALRIMDTYEVEQKLRFYNQQELPEGNIVAYTIGKHAGGDSAKTILIIHNGDRISHKVNLPKGEWHVYINGSNAGNECLEIITEGIIEVQSISTNVLIKKQ